jgi:hypothetical protein
LGKLKIYLLFFRIQPILKYVDIPEIGSSCKKFFTRREGFGENSHVKRFYVGHVFNIVITASKV